MSKKERTDKLIRIKDFLLDALLLIPNLEQGDNENKFNQLYNKCCGLLFKDDFYLDIWDESTLLRLRRLFEVKCPNIDVFGEKVERIAQRRILVCHINDLFFSIISHKSTVEEVCKNISTLTITPCDSLQQKLKTSNRLEEIRSSKIRPSEKIQSFIDLIEQDYKVDFADNSSAIRGVLGVLVNKEESKEVNALLVNNDGTGVVIPLRILVIEGKGEVKHLINRHEDFEVAIQRARTDVVNRRYLNKTDDVLYGLEFTDARYRGSSIGLPAEIGMWSEKSNIYVDSYTAFTGDVYLLGDKFIIRGVAGISQKLDAAISDGIRRVFIPEVNSCDVNDNHKNNLEIHLVRELTDVLIKLQTSCEPIPGDSLYIRKINKLRSYCLDQGWEISEPVTIQDGFKFTISPFNLQEVNVNIYNTGTHSPQNHHISQYRELIENLRELDQSQIPLQEVNRSINIKDVNLQELIRKNLDQLGPSNTRNEQYCLYVYEFVNGKERIIVKQYQAGKLMLQGRGGELYKVILEVIITLCNVTNPNAKLKIEDYIRLYDVNGSLKQQTPERTLKEVSLPHIGTDESGKGDYFGPMVIAGVWMDEGTRVELEQIGVKDSKQLSDKKCKVLAEQIRKICRDKYVEVELIPEKYNDLYEEFKNEGKNLNHLLAWGHARAIEDLLVKNKCSYAIADQFGDEKYIESKLMEKGRKLQLVQVTKGERYIAVAAASILARDRFLTRMEKLSQEYGLQLPKGASDLVVEVGKQIVSNKGKAELTKTAKLHHKTTIKILGEA